MHSTSGHCSGQSAFQSAFWQYPGAASHGSVRLQISGSYSAPSNPKIQFASGTLSTHVENGHTVTGGACTSHPQPFGDHVILPQEVPNVSADRGLYCSFTLSSGQLLARSLKPSANTAMPMGHPSPPALS